MSALTASGFHAGELLVQQRAGVAQDAARLEGMLRPAQLDGGPATWLAGRTFAVLSARDCNGRLWTAPLVGAPGFLQPHGATLNVVAVPDQRGPLGQPLVGGPGGVIVVEFATQRRLRINGTLSVAVADHLVIEADQAYGNCPSYIQRRGLEVALGGSGDAAPATAGDALTAAQRAVITSADTFFLGTVHPERGADTSHKGGAPGFVRVEDDGSLWWPDYPGNNMFNSFGNLVENPEAALLFVDFATGRALHISGTAELEWSAPGGPGDDGGTGRRVRVRPERVVEVDLALRAGLPQPSPDNPDLVST
ncbi:MAG TPA: pyridoxamine 5'-phosphate oxidase family protein, partial [Sporichthyaceae bacterium]